MEDAELREKMELREKIVDEIDDLEYRLELRAKDLEPLSVEVDEELIRRGLNSFGEPLTDEQRETLVKMGKEVGDGSRPFTL